MKNIRLSDDDYHFIVTLEKFDLVMFLSDINDHGWNIAKTTMEVMKDAINKKRNDTRQ